MAYNSKFCAEQELIQERENKIRNLKIINIELEKKKSRKDTIDELLLSSQSDEKKVINPAREKKRVDCKNYKKDTNADGIGDERKNMNDKKMNALQKDMKGNTDKNEERRFLRCAWKFKTY